jgi:FtsH-binding integral membrane protein
MAAGESDRAEPMGDDDRPQSMEALAIIYRLLQLTLLVMGIAATITKRSLSTRAIVGLAVIAVVVLSLGTGVAETLRIGVPIGLVGNVFIATALFFGVPGIAVTVGTILLRRDQRQIWLRVGVLCALYFVAAHVGLKLVTHVALVNASG